MDISTILAALGAGTGPKTLVFAVLIYGVIQVLNIGINKIKKALDKTEKIKGIVKREEADKVIQGLLDGAIGQIGGERIQVIEFTNTNKNIALVPFDFMHCTYESYQLGKQSMADIYKGIPTTIIGLFLQRLNTQSYMVINVDCPDNKLPPSIYDMLEKRFATKSLYVPVRSPISKRMIGYVLLDSNDVAGFSDIALKTMRSLADQVGVLLTLGEW
jgi:hypothetical protein